MTLQIRSVAAAAGHELLRRRLGMALLVLLPLGFYASVPPATSASASGVPFGLVSGTVGMAWSVSGAAFFLTVAARHVDERLMLVGYRPSQLAVGRLLLLESSVVVLALVFTAVIDATIHIQRPGLLLAAAIGAGTIAVPLGLAIAAFLPRELEGALLLMGIVGIQMSVASGANPPRWLPFSGPVESAASAAAGHGATARPLLFTLGWAATLLCIAVTGWWRGLPDQEVAARSLRV